MAVDRPYRLLPGKQLFYLKVSGTSTLMGLSAVTVVAVLLNLGHLFAGGGLFAAGTIVLLGAVFVGLGRIGCPQCKNAIVTIHSRRTRHGGWLRWLLTFTRCPEGDLSVGISSGKKEQV